MITPVNGHVLIEPIKHEAFMASQQETYQEIGIVVSVYPLAPAEVVATIGGKIYFDSWLAAKYPHPDGGEKYYWLVKWEDVRAIESVGGVEKEDARGVGEAT